MMTFSTVAVVAANSAITQPHCNVPPRSSRRVGDVLPSITCDVLVVKPRAFVSPLSRPEEHAAADGRASVTIWPDGHGSAQRRVS